MDESIPREAIRSSASYETKPHFMETEGSLPFSQKSTISSFP
jgi:hypothetical protein